MRCNGNINNPSGTWEHRELIGAKVAIKSVPMSNFFAPSSSDEVTIKSIKYRISMDGRAITLIELSEYPGKFFTWKDLEIIEINWKETYPAVCGKFLCGQTEVGFEVSPTLTVLEELGHGIQLIDKNGNIISNRYVRLSGDLDIEDIVTDDDLITDINIRKTNGEILD